MVSTQTTATKEYSKLIFGVIGASVVAVVSLLIIIYLQNNIVRLVIIPPIAYAISLLFSFIFQTSVCPATNMTAAAITNISVLFSTGLVAVVLFLESIPLLSAFGYSEPISPMTGLPISRESSPEEYAKATDDNKHLKIQFLSGIVKAVLPVYFEEVHKTSLVYFYWMFWMTLLPIYLTLGIQGIC